MRCQKCQLLKCLCVAAMPIYYSESWPWPLLAMLRKKFQKNYLPTRYHPTLFFSGYETGITEYIQFLIHTYNKHSLPLKSFEVFIGMTMDLNTFKYFHSFKHWPGWLPMVTSTNHNCIKAFDLLIASTNN